MRLIVQYFIFYIDQALRYTLATVNVHKNAFVVVHVPSNIVFTMNVICQPVVNFPCVSGLFSCTFTLGRHVHVHVYLFFRSGGQIYLSNAIIYNGSKRLG